MKKITLIVIAMLILVQVAIADTPTTGDGTGLGIGVEDFTPLVWMNPDSRIFYLNPADGGREGIERLASYAFEGEQIAWDVLVMDKNGIEKVRDVYVTIGSEQGEGNDIEVNCDIGNFTDGQDISGFNARILEEQILELDAYTMAIYNCFLTVETPNSMFGQYWVVAEAEDLDGNLGTFDENEYWYFNPELSIEIDGELDFEDVRPGSASYSDSITIENTMYDSGVLLDIRISGTDFYDPTSTGTKCPVSNRLRLNSGGAAPFYTTRNINPSGDFVRTGQTNCELPNVETDLGSENGFDAICYYATKGDYDTSRDAVRRDAEGYVGIPYETGEESNRAPVISDTIMPPGFFFPGNSIIPGEDITLTFRVFLPEPCNADSLQGTVYLWAEAI